MKSSFRRRLLALFGTVTMGALVGCGAIPLENLGIPVQKGYWTTVLVNNGGHWTETKTWTQTEGMTWNSTAGGYIISIIRFYTTYIKSGTYTNTMNDKGLMMRTYTVTLVPKQTVLTTHVYEGAYVSTMVETQVGTQTWVPDYVYERRWVAEHDATKDVTADTYDWTENVTVELGDGQTLASLQATAEGKHSGIPSSSSWEKLADSGDYANGTAGTYSYRILASSTQTQKGGGTGEDYWYQTDNHYGRLNINVVQPDSKAPVISRVDGKGMATHETVNLSDLAADGGFAKAKAAFLAKYQAKDDTDGSVAIAESGFPETQAELEAQSGKTLQVTLTATDKAGNPATETVSLDVVGDAAPAIWLDSFIVGTTPDKPFSDADIKALIVAAHRDDIQPDTVWIDASEYRANWNKPGKSEIPFAYRDSTNDPVRGILAVSVAGN